MQHNNRLVWIDMEMSGLDPRCHVPLELSCVITDSACNNIASLPSIVIHQSTQQLATMSPWCITTHTASGLLAAVAESTITCADAQQLLISFIMQHCTPRTALLAGNSVWQDRAFLVQYMPEVVDYLFYRIVDVSTVKELVMRWYPGHPALPFKKRSGHRASDDITESIDELLFYQKHFFVEKL